MISSPGNLHSEQESPPAIIRDKTDQLETAVVTNHRDAADCFNALHISEQNIQKGDNVVIAGSSLLFSETSFEQVLHRLGAEVAVVDPSLDFSSQAYVGYPNYDEEKGKRLRSVKYELKSAPPKKDREPFSDQEFRSLRKMRFQAMLQSCKVVFTGTFPTLKLSNTFHDVRWHFDLFGPGYYLFNLSNATRSGSKKLWEDYLVDTIKSLGDNGEAVFFPCQHEGEWRAILNKISGLKIESYPGKMGLTGLKVKKKGGSSSFLSRLAQRIRR